MDENAKIERFKEIFQHDPLFTEVNNRGLLDSLFASCTLYQQVSFDSTYATKKAAELLDIPGKEQTLLNYLNRNDFTDYIDIFRKGERGYYRYTYKSLFQFKMILLLADNGMMPLDIASIIGTRPEYTDNNQKSKVTKKTKNKSDEDLQSLTKEIIDHRIRAFATKNMLEVQKKLAESDLHLWEQKMGGLVGRIEDIEMNLGIYKNLSQSLTQPTQPNKSFFSKLFGGSSSTEPDPVQVSEVESKIRAFESRLDRLVNEKGELQDKKISLLESIEDINKKIVQVNNYQSKLDSPTNMNVIDSDYSSD
ncbi:hypothetical protein [Cytobacillus purgationiresistens]|uniref:DNA-binding transcriptional MerR regulator n=1 Tax=Cytobacillus purgationiresistens TaxID=863449 RepID=A0ABU0ALD7_9BACI|nr:hypothetical protein [Cytobacillus purgationiresistens]MDQ0271203.1 DNA-binding transcriptional MerR regulator [Cytobacillus purgationiresistens]